ncbi:hypothetical protein [Vibrio vulnificus]|uniref:hypothetical protein n=1 Tax=Vibrio vulnificus TaxID=672 RepID=UPI0019D415DA|nr:hypothetical protein [Vibrio vulnificus]MBN8093875.1 hypothetical protein [Vibrio vulnificus]
MSYTNKFDELIKDQENWISQLSNSLSNLKKYKSGELSCSEEHFNRIKQEHHNLAKAVSAISERINNVR